MEIYASHSLEYLEQAVKAIDLFFEELRTTSKTGKCRKAHDNGSYDWTWTSAPVL